MKTAIKSLIIIAIIVSLSILSIVCIYYFREENSLAGYRSQILPSGRSIKVTSFHLAWGVEHDNRISNNDCFNLEYVSSVTGTDTQARDREALEVFELIRPISEQWGFSRATIAAFQSVEHKGTYDLFIFRRMPDGKWSFTQYPAKVFVND